MLENALYYLKKEKTVFVAHWTYFREKNMILSEVIQMKRIVIAMVAALVCMLAACGLLLFRSHLKTS
ncbi:MAG TPA: hypothetical protein DCO86_02905 [Spirochaetaceae bacterium]|nr:hypothetical protein [Spirochaetaceae bacterium]